MLYAFNAASNSTTPVWALDLAGYVNGTHVTCTSAPSDFPPCSRGLLGKYVGVTGTPVIDTGTNPHPTLYVTAAVEVSGSINFYLYAIDIVTGRPLGTNNHNNPVAISGSVTGENPGTKCTSDYPGNGTQIPFDYLHVQRSALLLLNGKVYVAFAAGNGETNNGWMFGYSFNFSNNTFSQTAQFNSTPFGTGGGFWGSGAGPASVAPTFTHPPATERYSTPQWLPRYL